MTKLRVERNKKETKNKIEGEKDKRKRTKKIHMSMLLSSLYSSPSLVLLA